jgi:hypothetical protein
LPGILHQGNQNLTLKLTVITLMLTEFRAVGIATHSTEEVGTIFLNALKARVPEYMPRAYLGDAAEAFANAAKNLFPSILIRLMCFVHIYKVSPITYG